MQNAAINAGMPARDLRHLIALYDAEIRFTDDTLGRLLSLLEKRGRLNNTLVVITADHGEEFFEHGGKGHQRTLFDEVVPDQVRLIDVMPTQLAMAGVEHPPQMQGRDLTPLLRGGHLPPVAAMSELLVDGRAMRSLCRPG